MLRGEFGRGLIGIPDPDRPDHSIILEMHSTQKTEVRLHWRDGQPELTIQVFLDADLVESEGTHDWTKPDQAKVLADLAARHLRDQAESVVAKAQKAGTDVLRAGEVLRTEFSTRKMLDDYDWSSKFPQVEIGVEIQVFIRRPGLITTPAQPHRSG